MQLTPLSTSIPSNPLNPLEQHDKRAKEREQELKETQKKEETQELHKSDLQKEEQKQEKYGITKPRETYGLVVLELMNDEEYQAFERATVGMTKGEKMIAAQSLYRLSELQEKHTHASFPKEQNNGYAKTINFGDKFARALYFGEQRVDLLS